MMLASTLRDVLASATDMDRTRDLSLTTDAFDAAAWSSLADMGLLGLVLPSQYGGADSSWTDLAIVFEELGRVVASVPLLSTLLASVVVLESASNDQRAALLPGLADGSAVGSLAVFEDAHGGGLVEPATTATRTDDGWTITGTKRFVTDAPTASLFVVSALLDARVGLFAVPADTEGLSVRRVPALDATRPLGDVIFDVSVPDDALLTAEDGVRTLQRAIDVGVVMVAAEQVGLSQQCLELSVDYAKTRYQFGRAIGSFQAIKHRCADMLVAVEHARSVAWHAAAALDDPDESAIATPLAKSVCSDAAVRVAGDTIQIFGGIGFTWEHDAHLYFKRAKATSLLLGSVAWHRDRLADAIGV